MSKLKLSLFQAALLLTTGPLWADDPRAGDVRAPSGSVVPTSTRQTSVGNIQQTTVPGANVPGMRSTGGVPQVQQAPAATAAQQAAPAAGQSAAVPASETPAAPLASPVDGAPAQVDSEQPSPAQSQPSVGGLRQDVKKIEEGKQKGDAEVGRVLEKEYDNSAVASPRAGVSAGVRVVAGFPSTDQDVSGQIEKAEKETFDPAGVVGFYKTAILLAEKAVGSAKERAAKSQKPDAKKNTQAADAFLKDARERVWRSAVEKAGQKSPVSGQPFLQELANRAYANTAAGAEKAAAAALKALNDWQSLSLPDRPLIQNFAALKDYVSRAPRQRKDAKTGHVRELADSGLRLVRQGNAYVASFPRNFVQPIPEVARSMPLSVVGIRQSEDGAWSEFLSDPSAANGRRVLGAMAGAPDAARYWLKAAAASLWHRVIDFFRGLRARLFPVTVDLGGGAPVRLRDPDARALKSVLRPRSAVEPNAPQGPSGVSIVSVDLRAMNRAYLSAAQGLAAWRPGVEAGAIFDGAALVAKEYDGLFGDASGLRVIETLRDRAAASGLSSREAQDLRQWLDRIYGSALARLDRQFLNALPQTQDSLVYADPASAQEGGMVRVLSRRAQAQSLDEALKTLGFDVELREGLLRAGASVETGDMKQALRDAVALLAGRPAARGDAAAKEQKLSRTRAFVKENAALARRQLRDMDLGSPSEFSTIGEVRLNSRQASGSYRVEERRRDGAVVLRDEDGALEFAVPASVLRPGPAALKAH